MVFTSGRIRSNSLHLRFQITNKHSGMVQRDDLVPFLLILQILSTEAYLEPCYKSMMDLFCENGERLKDTPLKYNILIFSTKEKKNESLSCM